MRIFLVFLLVIFLVLSINCQNKKKLKNNNDDDDEFAEFDDLFDDENNNKNNKPQQQQQQQQQKSQNFKNNDFDELDITVENEDENNSNEDDEFDELPKATKSPSHQQQQQQTTKSPQNENKKQQADNNNKVQLDTLDNEEFENFVDEEEFEGFEDPKQQNKEEFDEDEDEIVSKKDPKKKQESKQMPNLKIADVPEHLINTNNWKNYYLEIIVIFGIVVYSINLIYGKTKNSTLATAWFESNRELLEKNFALVGDDGTSTDILNNENAKLIKESDNIFGIWCSGRQSCLNMFIQLKFLKRQDLISIISGLFKPQNDQIIISVEFDRKDLDSYVFCLANRKQSQKLYQDYQDIATYCSEKKQLIEKHDLSSKYVLLNEIGEIPSIILDGRVTTFLKNNPDLIEYLLISDQFVGYKVQQDDQQNVQNQPAASANSEDSAILGLQNSRAMMIICINIPKTNKYSINIDDIEKVQPALLFTLYLIDKVTRIVLSKEAKAKAVKRRKEITEQNMKIINKQRQEAAQQRKEEKRRAEKEKIMNESDPEKQKKLEEKELKREKKKNLSKMKQIKIKSI